jgi:hypothetical protein
MKCKHIVAGILVTAGLWGAVDIRCTTIEQQAQEDGSIVFRDIQSTPLKSIIRMSIENRIPLGIVFGASPLLCADRPTINIKAISVSDAFSQALAGTGYKVANENNVYVLTGPDMTSHEMKLLNYRFEKFSATNSTMSHAGALLNGYIVTLAEGATGFTVDTLEGPSPEKINVKMQSATTEEIANRIVSLNNKGVWAFRPARDEIPTLTNSEHVRVFSYTEDQAEIEALTCESR